MNSRKPTAKQNDPNNEYKRNRRKSIVIISALFGSIATFVIIALIVVAFLPKDEQSSSDSERTYIFHEADYEFDIMKDPQYLDLDRQIYFTNSETGETVAIDREGYVDVPEDQKEYILLLCDFIDYAIGGKTEELNSLFSDEYIEADGKIKLDFTMQQLYNIKIEYVQSLSEFVDDTECTSYDYWLEYMIRKNNGTFRNDMESDCVRKEYVRVTKRGDRIGIDVLAPYTTEQIKSEVISPEKIMKISLIAVITLTAIVAGYAIITKNKK